MRYTYDMLGGKLRQASMEAGERWTLNDAAGKPIRAWNSRQYNFRTEYDPLRRPLKSFVRGGDPSAPNMELFAKEILFEHSVYGDSADTGLTEFQQQQANLRGKPYRQFDAAGVVSTDLYDFKGNSLRSIRKFAAGYKQPLDWSEQPKLETEHFSSTTRYDALNRAISVTAPDHSIYRPTFNEANFIETVSVNLRGAQANGQPVWTAFVTNIDYDAKGQRTLIEYGNGAATAYAYDPLTFRLIRLHTSRAANRNGLAAEIFKTAGKVQDLHYTYDPVGNIARFEDAALRTVFHANRQVDPVCDYTYDPLYRLIAASGREQIGQAAFLFAPAHGADRDYPFAGAARLGDPRDLQNYSECYEYDPAGNFLKMLHRAEHRNWTREYAYREASQIEPGRHGNRVSQTALHSHGATPAEAYDYDIHGNITRMPHLPLMQWNFKDQLGASSRQVVHEGRLETTYYIYDAGGQRARKITEGHNGARKNERCYLGGFEVYREYAADGDVRLRRETLQVMDDKQRIALVETLTIDRGGTIVFPNPAPRYQLANHLGSACLELDPAAGLISYEEYSPYGDTTFQAGHGAAEISLKRYRYTGRERDEENGFTYHGARYYAPWLGRWTSCDPAGLVGGTNIYAYSRDNPINRVDPSGTDDKNATTPTNEVKSVLDADKKAPSGKLPSTYHPKPPVHIEPPVKPKPKQTTKPPQPAPPPPPVHTPVFEEPKYVPPGTAPKIEGPIVIFLSQTNAASVADKGTGHGEVNLVGGSGSGGGNLTTQVSYRVGVANGVEVGGVTNISQNDSGTTSGAGGLTLHLGPQNLPTTGYASGFISQATLGAGQTPSGNSGAAVSLSATYLRSQGGDTSPRQTDMNFGLSYQNLGTFGPGSSSVPHLVSVNILADKTFYLDSQHADAAYVEGLVSPSLALGTFGDPSNNVLAGARLGLGVGASTSTNDSLLGLSLNGSVDLTSRGVGVGATLNLTFGAKNILWQPAAPP